MERNSNMAAPHINTRKRYKKEQILRIDIISQLYKRGYSYREIQEEVKTRLNLEHYSLQTVHKDIQTMLQEWRETRIENVEHSVQLELERIDEATKEAWNAWEKSKNDYERKKAKQQRVPVITGEGDEGSEKNEIVKMEQQREEVICYGDPRYLEVIHKNSVERRKLLGLYAPEKKDVNGEFTFANFLMKTGVVDEQSEE